MTDSLNILLNKINAQSLLIVALFLITGSILISTGSGSWNEPKAVIGIVLISFSLLYSLFSYTQSMIKESYENIIIEYKTTIGEMRKSRAFEHDMYKTAQQNITGTQPPGETSGYIRKSDIVHSTPTDSQSS